MWGFERRLAGLRLEGRGRRDEHRAAAELASEAAAFLVGRLAERPQVSTGRRTCLGVETFGRTERRGPARRRQ